MMNFKLSRHAANWLSCAVLATTVAACSSDKAPAKDPADAARAAASPTDKTAEERDTTINISADFRRECQLPNEPQEAPHFEYADATLHARGANILDDVAKCLSEGALRGRVMTIIGRTDARGSAVYNKELSASRAEAARNYLLQRGVAGTNIRIIAHGEQGAQGKDEATWALDRRVDFELGDRTAESGGSASPSPIMEGTRMQGLSPGTDSKVKAATYADAVEGGKEAGAKSGK
jgi:peptidoglycan-associated lipoprotein